LLIGALTLRPFLALNYGMNFYITGFLWTVAPDDDN